MAISSIMNAVYFAFAILGAADYVLGNRLGFGAAFERGIGCTGKLIICMTGFMALAPFFGEKLTPIVRPVFTLIGADPSALAGLLLANDSGGASLAMSMAEDRAAGLFNGYIVASTMGGAVMCLIPMCILNCGRKNRMAVIYGLVIGIFSIPFGCAVGGFVAGIPAETILCNLIPVTALSVGLFMCLIFFSKWIIRPFYIFGKLLVAISLAGLLLTAAGELFGYYPISVIKRFSDIIPVIGNIALVLSGVFPMLELLLRLFRSGLKRCATALHVQYLDITQLIVSLVNIFPVFDRLPELTARGALLNCAFMIGADCLLGDHFAFNSQVEPDMVAPALIGQLTSAVIALGMAVILAPRLLGPGGNSEKTEMQNLEMGEKMPGSK